jgi:DNA-binding transcriptional LysR family regulator
MDRFRAMEVFVKVAEVGGFAAAARELTTSPAAVTRAVAALEEYLGTRLFLRSTRAVRLTEGGERFLADCRRILAELGEAEESAVGAHASPRGELRVTAPVLFGRLYVAPIIAGFLARHPLVTCQTLFVDRVVNLMDEGLDVAIRIGELPDSALFATRVGSVRRVVVAAPAYLRANGTPQHPRDLVKAHVIQALAVDGGAEWRFQERSRPFSVRLTPRLRMNTNDAVIDLVAGGWGLSRLMSYQVAPYLADGRLQSVLQDFEQAPLAVNVIHQEGRLVSKKIRTFVDDMVPRLRSDPAIN